MWVEMIEETIMDSKMSTQGRFCLLIGLVDTLSPHLPFWKYPRRCRGGVSRIDDCNWTIWECPPDTCLHNASVYVCVCVWWLAGALWVGMWEFVFVCVTDRKVWAAGRTFTFFKKHELVDQGCGSVTFNQISSGSVLIMCKYLKLLKTKTQRTRYFTVLTCDLINGDNL